MKEYPLTPNSIRALEVEKEHRNSALLLSEQSQTDLRSASVDADKQVGIIEKIKAMVRGNKAGGGK